MKKHLSSLVLIICLIFSACQNQCPPLTELQKADIEKQILKILDSLAISVEKLDAGWTTFLSSDEYLGHYVGGTVIPTKGEVTDSLKAWFSDRESQQFKTSKVSVTVLTENLVLVGWLNKFHIESKNGQIWDGDHAWTALLKKEDSGWKVIQDHESNGNWKVTEDIIDIVEVR